MLDMFNVNFEIYIEDKLVQSQRMKAPKEFLIINFMQTAQQIAEDPRPMKIKMIKPEIIWDNNQQKVLDIWTAFSNNAMVAWEESNQKV